MKHLLMTILKYKKIKNNINMYMKLFINVPIFIVSLAIGLFVAYITMPPTQIIYVYPNPDNEHKISFKDKADNCFHFKSTEVKCPDDVSKIRAYNIQ